jgi:putative nucleic acid binding protein
MQEKCMINKKTKIVSVIFIALIAIAVVVIYQVWNEPHRNIKNAEGINTTATELYTNLSKDSAKMKSRFINKIIIVSGEVKNILKNQKGQQIILLKTNISGGSVNCTMEEKAIGVKPGDKISIKGICSGYIGGDADIDLPGDVFLTRSYSSF